MNLRANGARNCRRNEQFLSLLQHKTRVGHFWTPKSEKLTWNILLYVGKRLFWIDSSLRFYFLSGMVWCPWQPVTTSVTRTYGHCATLFLTNESFWCFYIAFKDIKYTLKLDSLLLTTILSFLYQYFERNGKQAWARKLTADCLWFLPMGYHLCPYAPYLSDFSRESLIFFYFLVLFCSHPSIIRNCHVTQ